MTPAARYRLTIVFTVLTFAIEFFGNTRTNSLGLLSDALHLGADNFPLLLGLYALSVRGRGKNARQLERAITLTNIALLVLVGVSMGIASGERFVHPPDVSAWMLFYAVLGSLGNGAQFFSMRGIAGAHAHTHTGRGQVLHLGADFLASVGVVVGAAALSVTGSLLADIAAAAAAAAASLLGAGVLALELTHAHEHEDHEPKSECRHGHAHSDYETRLHPHL